MKDTRMIHLLLNGKHYKLKEIGFRHDRIGFTHDRTGYTHDTIE